MTNQIVNDKLVLVSGESAGGKSAALRNLINPEKVLYLNCEAGKKLPFRSKFFERNITDPLVVHDYFNLLLAKADDPSRTDIPDFDVAIVDTLTFLMEMYESKYVLPSTNTMQAWGSYAQFYKTLMQEKVAAVPQSVIFLAHMHSIMNDEKMIVERKVPVKGSLQKNGMEAYFSTVVVAKKLPLSKVEECQGPLLTITPEEEALGVKYVLQTKLTKDTVHERIRSPLGMWADNEIFIDNDLQLVLNRLDEYYG
jgi:hypothetical protein